MKALNNKLRELRFLHDEMTQQDLATRVEASRHTIISIGNRNFNPSDTEGFAIKLAMYIS